MTAVLVLAAKAALGLSLFYGVYALFLRNETHFQLTRGYLLASLALSFLIPAFPVPSPFRTILVDVGRPLVATSLPTPKGIGLPGVLAAVYAAGVLVFLVRLGVHLARLAIVVRKNGVRRVDGLRVVPVGAEFSPFSFLGLVFIDDRGLEPGEMRRIMAHERVHIRQLHSLDLLLMELAVIVLWFNPLVWPFKKSIQETHEYLADAGAAAQGFGGSGYRRLVFEQHVGARLFGVGNSFKQSQIIRRITMMSRNPSAGGSRWKCLLAVPAALALMAVFAVPRVAVSAVTGQEKADTSKADAQKQLAELHQLDQKAIDLKMEFKGTQDEARRQAIKSEMEALAKRRDEMALKLEAAGLLPPSKELPPEMRELKLKAEKIQAQLAAAQDPAEQNRLREALTALKAEAAALKVRQLEMKALDLDAQRRMTLEETESKLSQLQAKEVELRLAIDKAESAEARDQLKKNLQSVVEKQDYLKKMAAKAKAEADAKSGK